MKKIVLNESLKSIGYVLGYWIIFVIGPFFLVYVIKEGYRYNNMPIWIAVYVVLIAPFLYFIPYLLVNPTKKIQFIFWGLIIPYFIIYLAIYLYLIITKPLSISF